MRVQKTTIAAKPSPISEDDACLLPLQQFDHPSLHQRPPKWLPLPFARRHLNLLFGKACAGMNPALRADGWDVVRGFRRGAFSHRELATLRWAASGLREDALGMLHVMGRATIFELARGVHHMGWHGRGLAWELNAWGKKPLLPLPSLKGSIFRTVLRCTPKRALSLPLGHPDRREWLEDGLTGLTVDGLTFVVNSAALEQLQQRRRLAELTAKGSMSRKDGPNRRH